MSILAGARNCDLKLLAEELGETVNDNHKLKDLKKIILASKEYDEESAKEWMNTIINERKEREVIAEQKRQEVIAEQKRQEVISEQKRQEEIDERSRQDEIAERRCQGEIAERRHQDEIAERRRQDEIQIAEQKRQEEIELRKLEYEERKRKDEMEFELQKIRLGAEGRSLNSNSVANQNFERLGKQAEILENTCVTHLLGLLPYDVAQLIAREPDEIAKGYKEWHYDKQNSFKDDSDFTTNEKKKLYGITHNERDEPKCFHCSNFGHIARSCSMPKSVLICREGNETGHKIINCVAKETNHASEESLSVRLVGENSDESNSFLKKAKINNCDNVQALIDTGSSCCLLKISVAQKLKLKFERAVNKIYGFVNQKMPALTSIGKIKANIEVHSVKAENISIYVVPDDAPSVDLIIGWTWLHLPHIAYTKIGERVHIGCREDELFRNFPIDEKVNPVCL
ncbi:hypothetical protein AVEN_108644-1 [Araneus ventricosus]|uniref:CCHC-type domain-containing protein n=1 Tax=Araneus ventricosus TaxID=182803 RepID=A0A4Y2ISU1_ARAVE|nr:hypothetical protein AVEN_108644-1 [Araneus ventricosus]